MSFGRVALILFVVPLVLFIAVWICYRFYTPDARGPHSFSESEFRVYSADGRRVEGTLALPGNVPAGEARSLRIPAGRPYVVLVSDRGLDRDWNSAGVYFRTGERLARFWASHGNPVARFDPRGTGSEGGRRRHFSLQSQAEDLMAVIRAVEQPSAALPRSPRRTVPGSRAVLVAHGEGCVVALIAVHRLELRPNRLMLVGCGFRGTYLELWGSLILSNMRKAGAGRAALDTAAARMKRFLSEPFPKTARPAPVAPGRTPEGRQASGPEKNPDLAGFESALEFLRGPMAKEWTREAAVFSFVSELRFALGVSLPVRVFLPEYDSELEPGVAQDLHSAIGPRSGFEIRPLRAANHFLKVQPGPPGGAIGRAFARATPFTRLSPDLLETVLQSLR